MLAALAYTCICKTRFVISCSSESEDDVTGAALAEAARAAAPVAGRLWIDGGRRGFVCPECGTLHIRGLAAAAHDELETLAALN